MTPPLHEFADYTKHYNEDFLKAKLCFCVKPLRIGQCH